MLSLASLFRKVGREALALGVIASGRVRLAKRKALAGNVVTPIYFHNPNPRLFERCIQWLIENGYTFISADELVDILYHGATPPKGAVWISFDDGYKEWLEAVMPVVRKRKVPATFFIPSGIVRSDGLLPWMHRGKTNGHSGRDTLTVPELLEIAAHPGVSIGGHTVNHTVTRYLTEEKTRFELSESKRELESWTGTQVTCFAYPEGLFSGAEKPHLSEFGYRLAATTRTEFITKDTDPYFIPRFCVSDNISLPEAICNMTGVWRPVVAPLENILRRWEGSRVATA
jgi:poly-beta-1,6-N-acetyl-D-glucosamine N-deacetylase